MPHYYVMMNKMELVLHGQIRLLRVFYCLWLQNLTFNCPLGNLLVVHTLNSFLVSYSMSHARDLDLHTRHTKTPSAAVSQQAKDNGHFLGHIFHLYARPTLFYLSNSWGIRKFKFRSLVEQGFLWVWEVSDHNSILSMTNICISVLTSDNWNLIFMDSDISTVFCKSWGDKKRN